MGVKLCLWRPFFNLPAALIKHVPIALDMKKRAGLLHPFRSSTLDKLRVKMMEHSDGDRGWDVFSLEYQTASPLSTVFTEGVMLRYLRIFNFLWRLKRVEHALSASWKVMKPNAAVVKPGRSEQESAKVSAPARGVGQEMAVVNWLTDIYY